MENNIMAMVGAFIGIAIMLGIGVQILGNTVQDCTDLPGYNSSGTSSEVISTDWAGQCATGNTQTQNAYTLIVIILIVVAAVAILTVVRML